MGFKTQVAQVYPAGSWKRTKILPNAGLCGLPRLQLWEQNDVADTFLPQQHHTKSIDSHPHTSRGRHAVFERNKEVFIQFLLLASCLMLQSFALFDGIVLLSVSWRDFLAVDAALKNLNCAGVDSRELCQRD